MMLTLFKNIRLNAFVALITLALLAGCAPRPNENNPAEMARVFGECSFKLNTKALNLNTLPSNDPRATVIQKIVDNLLASRYRQFPWKVQTTIFENTAPNAFTTGGGYLGAFSGIYAMTDNEAALAGVIAHELAHMEKQDPLELASYMDKMLAQQVLLDGIDNDDTGQSLKTVMDFCLRIPGLVSASWKNDINVQINDAVHPSYNNEAVPYIPFTFSDNPESPYSPKIRDPHNTTRVSACNNKQRETFDEFIVINPEYYLEHYPNQDSIPTIPDGINDGVSGISSAETIWEINPWVGFQHLAFSRYAECQSDEAGILNLFSSGYNPLALNSSFNTILTLFKVDEQKEDILFSRHPSLAQRIEDNETFINSNSDVFPTVAQIKSNPLNYKDYIVMADQVNDFETLRDNARNAIFGTPDIARATATTAQQKAEHFEPITISDIAVLLNTEVKRSEKAFIAGESASMEKQCAIYKRVYKTLTGKDAMSCIPAF